MKVAEKAAVLSANNVIIAENEHKVYDSGVEAGREAENTEFWDIYQNKSGYTERYRYAGVGWNSSTFFPKHDIKPTAAMSMFDYHAYMHGEYSLKQRLIDCGVSLDTSQNTEMTSFFSTSWFTEIPIISCESSTDCSYAFNYCRMLKTIEKLILREDGTNTFKETFGASNVLENIIIEGVIGNDIKFNVCPLTVESCKSVINALMDFSGTSAEYSRTLTLKASCVEALEAEGLTSPNGNTWLEYIDDKKWNLVS